jgi:hypothetical protein
VRHVQKSVERTDARIADEDIHSAQVLHGHGNQRGTGVRVADITRLISHLAPQDLNLVTQGQDVIRTAAATVAQHHIRPMAGTAQCNGPPYATGRPGNHHSLTC